ncbi:hypothetical protein SAMN03080594_11319 [Arenibacter palladensis]|jgi:hypothetical protein|uniref:Por secretion system C-terminal sorting domain-containing protein n=1 Tax=Arenibacter palladensis TaxID=237373 RepID=A0A1M5H768_9FLAO|nr:hypothetical protein [Arenibacter palladensis]MDO6605422.1 hypothetical protein [Arenibacter palladensis]SHG11840.1 hypothetical protein SAMN03080594_11319 [Arenibacter palladensis]|tara:strand:+ start:4497 stop:5084 length:588 start_codon:yes stop_codon:yes gene_type:complete
MKAVLKLTAVAALLLSSTIAMANDPGMYLTTVKEAKRLVLKLNKQTESSTLTLTDTEKHQIFMENIKEDEDYTKKFDLSKLDEGLYFLKMESLTRTVEFTISVEDSEVNVIARDEITKPFFRKNGDVLYLNYLNQKLSPVVINVVDSSNRVVFTQKFDKELVVGKVFNFTNAVKDDYTVSVSEGTKTYYETISVN